jgi:HK97 family phage portal protein
MAKDKLGRFKSALLNWMGVPISLTTAEFWREYAGSTSSGRSVTVENALKLSTVYACVRLLSQTVSTLPLKVYERQSDGSRTPATSHPLYSLLGRQPNAEMTPQRFLLFIVACLCLRGNAFVEIIRIGQRIAALNPLYPQGMSVKRDDNTGKLIYRYNYNGRERVIDERDLMHIRAFGTDGIMGLSPIMTSAEIIGAAAAAEEAAAKIFAQGLQASGFLTVDSAGGAQGAGTLTDKQRELLRKSLSAFSGSKNAGKTMVLEAGLKYQGITMNPEDAQMLETRAFGVEEICRCFQVAPFMVGHMTKQSSWAASVEAQNLFFLTNTLRPLLVNIEQEITRCLIPEAEFGTIYAEFSVEGLLRADSAGRAAFYNSALNNGWMSRNEVRRAENLPPIEGGDIYTVQSALVPIQQLGQAAPAMSAKAVTFVADLIAATQKGDKEGIKRAFTIAHDALTTGDPDAPVMTHALMSLDRLDQAA